MLTFLRGLLVFVLAVALIHALRNAQADDDACHVACTARDFDSGKHAGGVCVCSSVLEATAADSTGAGDATPSLTNGAVQR